MQQEGSEKQISRPIGPQVHIAVTLFVSTAVCGLGIGHSAVLLPRLQSENSSLTIDEDTGSWIVSVYSIVGPLGCLVGGLGSDIWGRRTLNIVALFGMVIGWILITFSQNAAMILWGRIFEGFSRSTQAAAITIFNHELADPKYRGFFLYGMFTFVYVGMLAISTFGTYLVWRLASGISCLLAIISLFLYFFLPESPTWYIRQNQPKKAERALKWIWRLNKESQIKEELNDIIKSLQTKENDTQDLSVRKFTSFAKTLFQPHILKPFLIMHFFNTIQVFCGVNILTFYTIDMLSYIRGDGPEIIDDYSTTIVISALRLVVTLSSSFLTLIIGRRIFAITSGICSTIPALILGGILYYEHLISPNQQAYIKLVLLLIYIGAMSLGFNVLPSAMIGETQHSLWRGFICGYLYAVNDLVLGGMLKLYPWLMANIQIHGLFIMFGVACAVCTVFVYLFLPETKDVTLQQIEEYFKQPNVMWITRPKKDFLINNTKGESTEL